MEFRDIFAQPYSWELFTALAGTALGAAHAIVRG